jgi:ankyrin repeat protein
MQQQRQEDKEGLVSPQQKSNQKQEDLTIDQQHFLEHNEHFLKLLKTFQVSRKDIFVAAASGDLGFCREQIENQGVGVNATDPNGNTALHWAAYKRHPHIVDYLLSKGASVTIRNKQTGQTPLHWVISSGDLVLLHTLLKTMQTLHFPSMSLVSRSSTNAVISSPSLLVASSSAAVSDSHVATDSSSLLPSASTHLTVTPTNNSTTTKTEERYDIKEETVSVHNNSVFQTLRDNDGYDLLIVAAQHGHLAIVHYLIQCLGHRPNTRDNRGHTPLHWAAFKGHSDVVRYLLHVPGVEYDAVDDDGMTALHWAAISGSLRSVKCLLQVASSPQLNPHYQHASAERPTQSVVTSLPSRMFPNCAELLHTFVEKRDKEGHTAEYYATQKRFPSIQRLLAKYATHTLPFELRGGCYFELWIALPCVLEWSAVAIISWLPFVWALCCLCILAIVTSSLARPYFPGMRVVNGLGVGWFLANWLLALFLYFTKIIQVTASRTMETILFLIAATSILFLFLKMATSNAGVLPKLKSLRLDAVNFIEDIASNRDIAKICATCRLRRPLRSEHCRQCDVCVSKFDHHSHWVSNCVGARNHSLFVILLFTIVVVHLWFVRLCYLALSSLPETKVTTWSLFVYWYNAEPALFLLLLLFLAQAIWESILITRQLHCIVSNLTTNEIFNRKRYDYLKGSNGEFYNPFDRGLQKNILEFFGLIQPLYDWDNLYTLEHALSI